MKHSLYVDGQEVFSWFSTPGGSPRPRVVSASAQALVESNQRLRMWIDKSATEFSATLVDHDSGCEVWVALSQYRETTLSDFPLQIVESDAADMTFTDGNGFRWKCGSEHDPLLGPGSYRGTIFSLPAPNPTKYVPVLVVGSHRYLLQGVRYC